MNLLMGKICSDCGSDIQDAHGIQCFSKISRRFGQEDRRIEAEQKFCSGIPTETLEKAGEGAVEDLVNIATRIFKHGTKETDLSEESYYAETQRLLSELGRALSKFEEAWDKL